MNEYMSDYVDHLKSLIPAKHDPETDPVLCVDKWDLLDEVRQMLTASFKAAISQKQTRLTKMETNDIARPIEDRMGILYKKINKAESKVNDVIALAICYSNMSIVRSRHETKKKLLLRKSYLKKSLELLNRKELDRRAILIVLRASLQLECVYHKLNEPEKCYSLLHKALALCHKYTKYGEKFPAPINILCVSLDIEPVGFYPNSRVSFMTLYRELLNRLKPIEEILKFDSNVWDAYTLVNIMQKFLMRQSVMVMANPVKTDLAWIHAACQLSASFLRLSKFRLSFTEARNCIASAQYMLELNDKEVSKAETSNNSEDFHDANYYVTKASVALAWCNYSNLILFLSKYNMSYIRLGTGFPIHKAAKSISMSSTTSVKFLILTHLEENLKIIHNYTNQVTDTYYVTTRDDAKSVFLHYIKWFEVTKTCYKKIGFVESTKLIAYNISTTYKYLAYFEPDKDNQIKLLKRQIQILKDICDIDVYKVTLENFLMRRIYCDLAVSYAIIVDMILENMEFNTTYVEEGNLKEYIRNSVKCYKKYIFLLRSYYNKKLV